MVREAGKLETSSLSSSPEPVSAHSCDKSTQGKGNDHPEGAGRMTAESRGAGDNWHSHQPEWKNLVHIGNQAESSALGKSKLCPKGCSGCSTQKSLKANLRRNKNIISKWHNCIPEKSSRIFMKTKNIQHSSKTKKFPIFGILKKKSATDKKPENTIHNEDKNRSIETD